MTTGTGIAPTQLELDGVRVSLRPMHAADKDAILTFARELPAQDLLFLQRDIRLEKVVTAWIEQTAEGGSISSLVAVDGDGHLRGCSALVRDRLSWSSHVADIRILVGVDSRSMGLGRLLALHCVDQALAEDVEKLTVHTTPEQEGALRMFEELGFRPEALLRDHVRDAEGQTSDIVILALSLARYSATRTAYSL
ncbi:GNAT family N-acetyltransferase [Novosphingobium album (ex Hu et al. 2023)]|uniref:GNAT family N-acetyltransferase n=1 Tax=Novosphingobium album (ex Hu et al. 2023) TaxID=2930093 RepID=A0ABT0AW06_9SPHN|nr:GNAT family N-acetyltransferase [Novosphingobium album (ex Hu et al. 2023)]MCJ2176959.1 GNAT family N-acetyltransferase [Novosphingobium album (ex Hu et al. 2023)]